MRQPEVRDACSPIDRLWNTFTRNRATADREALFAHYLPYAQAVATRLFAGRHVRDVEPRDFRQLACVGLLLAIDRFDPRRGVSFETFATPSIRGSVLDGVGAMTDAQEQVRLAQRVSRERIASLTMEDAGSEAEALQAGNTFQALVQLATGLAIAWMLDDTGMVARPEHAAPAGINAFVNPYANPYETAVWQQTIEGVHAALTTLCERSRAIIHYHYFLGLEFARIGEMLGVSRSHISRLHRAALDELRGKLGERPQMHLVV